MEASSDKNSSKSEIKIIEPRSIEARDYDHIFKIVLLGDSGVGKTSIIRRFAEDTFSFDNISTLGVDWKCKFLQIDGVTLKLTVWDTAGQEKYSSLITSFFRDVGGAIFVYDVTKLESLTRVKTWIRRLEDNCVSEKVSKILVGNKMDFPLNRHEVSRAQAEEFAAEVSAESGENVDLPFFEIARQMLEERKIALIGAEDSAKGNKGKKKQKDKKSCC